MQTMEGSSDGSSMWVPATPMGDLDGVPGFQLQPGLALASVGIWRLNQWLRALPVSLLLSVFLLLQCMCPSKIHMLKSNLQGDGIRR